LSAAAAPARDAAALSSRIERALSAVDLTRHARVQTRHYSLGTKRRLSLAIAYIMGPALVLLDEVTSGVDPAARKRRSNVAPWLFKMQPEDCPFNSAPLWAWRTPLCISQRSPAG
jgi:ABC-type branched-subunit amino acid transport system ATPase component